MGHLPYDHRPSVSLLSALARVVWHRTAAALAPRAQRPLWLVWTLLLLGLVVQLVSVYWLAQLVDLSISLMELWAELARKHLEITL